MSEARPGAGSAGGPEYEGQSFEELQKKPPEQRHRDEEDLENALQVEDLRKSRQANEQRESFFKWAKRLIVAVLLVGAMSMAFYIGSQWGKLEAGVFVAWFASVIVETLGLGFIIGEYLFEPSSGPRRRRRKRPRRRRR